MSAKCCQLNRCTSCRHSSLPLSPVIFLAPPKAVPSHTCLRKSSFGGAVVPLPLPEHITFRLTILYYSLTSWNRQSLSPCPPKRLVSSATAISAWRSLTLMRRLWIPGPKGKSASVIVRRRSPWFIHRDCLLTLSNRWTLLTATMTGTRLPSSL